MTAPTASHQDRVAQAYDRKVARWRAIVDWAKNRPWALRAISPMARGRGRLRFLDRLLDRSSRPACPDFTAWESHTLAACWIGHATMLLRIGGITILTDPVFSPRVGLGWIFGTLGPARLVAPACSIKSLPKIDLILISHAHFDHLDRPTLSRLPKSSTVVCARGLKDLLEDLDFARVIELEPVNHSSIENRAARSHVLRGSTEESRKIDSEVRIQPTGLSGSSPDDTIPRDLKGVRITAIPQRHWGARIVLDNFRGYCAFVIESADGNRILFGGDTAYQEAWKPIGDSGGVDLAIVGIGAYNPWIEGHADPEQAWQMAMHAGARRVVPMHHGTFKLSREPMQEPLARFLLAAGKRVGDVVCRSMGDVWSGP